MKKIFTLIAMALVAVIANAQTTIFDAAAADWASVDLTTGTKTVGDVTWYGGGSASIASGSKTFADEVQWTARIKFGGKSTFKSGSTLVRVLRRWWRWGSYNVHFTEHYINR